MEHYSLAPQRSMTMREDPVLSDRLARLIALAKIDVALETGTFLGTGSTAIVSEAFQRVAAPKRFVTLEVNFANWCRATANLRRYPFVECRWGATVAIEAALEFLRTDEMLVNHTRYSGIYIDDTDDPIGWYSREICGQLPFSQAVEIPAATKELLWGGENLLADLLRLHADHRPLIVLDSAGGIGLLEFRIVLEPMKGRQFFLLLDDTHHLKHYRSLEHIRGSADFDIVAQGTSWVLAAHCPA